MQTVYVVDDSALIRDRLREMFSAAKDTCLIGESGDALEAMKEIRALHPDTVILDIQLPGGSGIEILRHIRKAGIKTRVIILTNFAYPQYREGCLEAGAEFFLSKSKDFDLLPSILNSLDPAEEKGQDLRDDPDEPPGSIEDKPP